MNRTPYVRLARPVSRRSDRTACGLPHHTPGQRVQWSAYDTGAATVVRRRGTVLAHTNRTLTIRADNGEQVVTSCGHVGKPTR